MIEGEISPEIIRPFKQFIRSLKSEEKEIVIRINSHGGDRRTTTFISRVIILLESRGLSVTTQAINAGSAAFRLFISGTKGKRIVAQKTTGYIHLPVEHSTGVVDLVLQERVAEQISGLSYGKLTKNSIFRLENEVLSGKEMVKLGFADELVIAF